MENSEMIVSFSGSFMAYLEARVQAQEQQIIAELKALLDDESLNQDEYSELIADAICRLYKANGSSNPGKTVQKLENILDESAYRDSPLFSGSYLSALRVLSEKLEPPRAKQFIAVMEDYAKGTCAFEDHDNVFQYCLALEHLCCKQSKMGDVDGARDTLCKLSHIFTSLEDDHSGIARCYAVSLVMLCGNKQVSETDACAMVDTLEHLAAQTQLAENEEIALQYMLGLFYLCCMQSGEGAAHSALRAGKIAEDSRYAENQDITIWYSTILRVLMEKQPPVERKKTFKKIQAMGAKPCIAKDERYISAIAALYSAGNWRAKSGTIAGYFLQC